MSIVIISQSKSTYRGGTVYLEREYMFISERGIDCRVVRMQEGRFSFFLQTFWYVATSWIWNHEIRGNGPWILGLALVAKKSSVYIGSPVHQWSKKSRWLLRVTSKLRNIRLIAASKYVRDEVIAYVREPDIYVSYAKIKISNEVQSCEVSKNSRVVLIVMAPGDKSKGWIKAVRIVRGMRHLKPIVAVYGRYEQEDIDMLKGLEVDARGIRSRPFDDLVRRFPGEMHIYIGMSEYEGLHMAVVEAGLQCVPSILSDIPAHRELEDIGRKDLLIVKTTDVAIETLISVTSNVWSYKEQARRYSQMAHRFVELANSSEIDI